ncbi:MAG: bactofilin family protein [Anaerolineae bacterium]|mgnify:CR=1 FL=1|jgi:cytoskeletal protein CcmA (bactofilin family)|nr:polymer-forming cytoskeletal protein [Chloroflexota bacterium]
MPLFGGDRPPVGVGGLETVLGTSTDFRGVLKSDGNIRIDGVLQGTIETAGNLVIGPSARIVADIRANAVQVWGQVQGTVKTSGRLEILSSGRVFGEVSVGSMMIDEGGLFRGQCYMDGQDVDALPAASDPQLLEAGGVEVQSVPSSVSEQTAAAPSADDEAGLTGQDPQPSQDTELR